MARKMPQGPKGKEGMGGVPRQAPNSGVDVTPTSPAHEAVDMFVRRSFKKIKPPSTQDLQRMRELEFIRKNPTTTA